MTQEPGALESAPAVTRVVTRGIVTRVVAGIALAALLAGTVAACGRYGPPPPYPPEGEEGDDA